MSVGMPTVEPVPVDPGPAAGSFEQRRELRRRRRLRSLRRTLATMSVWTVALLVSAWLMLAGIAGFAHA